MEAIAEARRRGPEALVPALGEILPRMFGRLSALLADRIIAKNRALESRGVRLDGGDLLARIELPMHMRALFGAGGAAGAGSQESGRARSRGGSASADRLAPKDDIDLGKWSDGLPFPALASTVLGGAAFAASKVLYGKRPFLEAFADRIGRHRHPRRALWLTDTLADRNGVSHVLQAMLEEARRRDLPVDFLACRPAAEEPGQGGFPLEEGPHLRLLPALAGFTLPVYRDQPIRLPGLLELQRVFLEGGYDRIVCSTEAPMGLYALYLKQAFNVPAWFYAHTDWMDFARRTLRFDPRRQDRLRRILRAFYRQFDGVFLLNTEQRDQFASPDMGLRRDRLRLTGHWADARFRRREADRSKVFAGIGPQVRVLLYAGRLSEEKGVMELPEVLRRVREAFPETRLAFAGTGPCRDRLAEAVPDALFLGWLDADRLAEAYSAADVLLLPSWFDTFSCALLEALGCGLPAVAYRSKGPRDILAGDRGGLLADGPAEMAALVSGLLADPAQLRSLSEAAVRRAADYDPTALMDGLLADLGMGEGAGPVREESNPGIGATENPPDEAEILGALMALMDS
jgi:glycosyltransferase involved in cell wall biosynthesis